MRIGHGYDVHRLVEGRKLILGGVEINYNLGLLGHSDADVLVHAIMDAILGALGLGDIGVHFPDNDKQYENIDSMLLLEKVGDLMIKQKMLISNIDATIVAQEPKISPYIDKMRDNIARVLTIDKSQINIKATTEEKLGFTGDLLGIKAYSVCLLNSFDESFVSYSSEKACNSCGGCSNCHSSN